MRATRLPIFLSLLLAAALAAAPAAVSAARTPKASKVAPPAKSLLEGLELFQVSPAHSPIEFSIGWMGLSKVRGAFADFAGTLALDRADLTRSSVTLVIRTKSLTTFNERRDKDLKSADWFDVDKFPTAVFTSREIVKQGEGYVMRGSLALHGVTKDIEIPFTFNGRLKDMTGDDRAGFEGHTALNRKDYGIVGPARYNALLELGKAMVGDDVDLALAVEAIHPTPKDTLQDRAADSLWRAIVARGAAPVAKDYRALRSATADSLMPVNEPRLNAVGYQLVDRGQPLDGLEVFKLQADAFPQSASGLVGMAYAYATLGDRENAAANGDKAVAMNPSATRALEILRLARAGAAN
jgi:polyisoprenoid-binding protein YceI